MKIRILALGRGYHHGISLPDQFELPFGAVVGDAVRVWEAALPPGTCASPTALAAVSGCVLGTITEAATFSLADGDELLIISPVAGG